MKVTQWWKLSSDESYLVMEVVYWWKLKLSKKWKGVMACDVSPVAMFSILLKLLKFLAVGRMRKGWTLHASHHLADLLSGQRKSLSGGGVLSCSIFFCIFFGSWEFLKEEWGKTSTLSTCSPAREKFCPYICLLWGCQKGEMVCFKIIAQLKNIRTRTIMILFCYKNV